MYKLTKQERVAGVIDSWKRQYRKRDGWSHEVLEKLVAAQPLTEQKVIEIVGNESWTRMQCQECGESVDALVFLEATQEYGPEGYCESCLHKAVALIGGKS